MASIILNKYASKKISYDEALVGLLNLGWDLTMACQELALRNPYVQPGDRKRKPCV